LKAINAHLKKRRYTFAFLLILFSLFVLFKSFIFGLISIEIAVPIDPSRVNHYDGYLYTAKIEHELSPLFEVIDESLERAPDNLTLTENGRALGPAHTSHNEIQAKGHGRFSHWNGQAVFSSSDGSDPRTNGLNYVASVTAQPAERWGYVALACIWIAGLAFSRRLEPLLMIAFESIQRNTSALVNSTLFLVLGILTVFVTGLLGSIGQGAIKPSGLGIAIIWHGLIGLLVALLPFFLGGGFLGLLRNTASQSTAGRILGGFPLGLFLAFLSAASLISMKFGWILAAMILLVAIAGWSKPSTNWQQIARYLKLVAMVFPFGLLLSGWAALYWHGPFHNSDGHSAGDMVFYTTSLQLLSAYGLPLRQFALEGEIAGAGAFFNQLFPIVGAGVSKAVPLDPALFLICSTFMTYVVGISLVIVAFKDETSHKGLSLSVMTLVVLAVLAAGRYPLWIAESPPVSHALVLSVCIVWMALKSEKSTIVSTASLAAAIIGSVLSKVVTFGVLSPIALAPSVVLLTRTPLKIRIALLSLLAAGAIYCVWMLSKYLPLYLSTGRLGPETFLYVITDGMPLRKGIVFVLRDLSVLILMSAWFRMFKLPMAIALSIGALSFLVNAFLFQINHGVVILATAMLVIANPASLVAAPVTTFLGMIFALPAFLNSDPTGMSAATVWLIVIAGTLCCTLFLLRSADQVSRFPKTTFSLSITAMICVLLLAIAVERGLLRLESSPNNLIPATAADIWKQVKIRTDKDVLVFTDQTSPTGWEMLGGWNNFALSGERQIYVANWVQTSLRSNPKKRDEVFAINDAVVSGAFSPDQISISRTYSGFVAVVSVRRQMKASWRLIYRNEDWAIYQWSRNKVPL
jgi:hypothetical protein